MEKTEIPQISVIVCIWNNEKTIRKAVDSYLQQTFRDYELILMDDGSPDSCPQIIDDYAARIPMVRALHKPNGGLADARNYALQYARGKYTIFWDPDDFVDPDCLQQLWSVAEKDQSEMVICDYYHNDKYRQTYAPQRVDNTAPHAVLRDVVSGKLFGYCWNKLIRRDVYSRFQIKYPIGFYGYEDQYTMCTILMHDIKVSYLPKAFYHYVYYPGSLSRHYDQKTFENDLRGRELFCNQLKETDLYPLAWQVKSYSIVSRAFLFGQKCYDSRTFRKIFKHYQKYIHHPGALMTVLYWLSFHGMYQLAHHIYDFLFKGKQWLKHMAK